MDNEVQLLPYIDMSIASRPATDVASSFYCLTPDPLGSNSRVNGFPFEIQSPPDSQRGLTNAESEDLYSSYKPSYKPRPVFTSDLFKVHLFPDLCISHRFLINSTSFKGSIQESATINLERDYLEAIEYQAHLNASVARARKLYEIAEELWSHCRLEEVKAIRKAQPVGKASDFACYESSSMANLADAAFKCLQAEENLLRSKISLLQEELVSLESELEAAGRRVQEAGIQYERVIQTLHLDRSTAPVVPPGSCVSFRPLYAKFPSCIHLHMRAWTLSFVRSHSFLLFLSQDDPHLLTEPYTCKLDLKTFEDIKGNAGGSLESNRFGRPNFSLGIRIFWQLETYPGGKIIRLRVPGFWDRLEHAFRPTLEVGTEHVLQVYHLRLSRSSLPRCLGTSSKGLKRSTSCPINTRWLGWAQPGALTMENHDEDYSPAATGPLSAALDSSVFDPSRWLLPLASGNCLEPSNVHNSAALEADLFCPLPTPSENGVGASTASTANPWPDNSVGLYGVPSLPVALPADSFRQHRPGLDPAGYNHGVLPTVSHTSNSGVFVSPGVGSCSSSFAVHAASVHSNRHPYVAYPRVYRNLDQLLVESPSNAQHQPPIDSRYLGNTSPGGNVVEHPVTLGYQRASSFSTLHPAWAHPDPPHGQLYSRSGNSGTMGVYSGMSATLQDSELSQEAAMALLRSQRRRPQPVKLTSPNLAGQHYEPYPRVSRASESLPGTRVASSDSSFSQRSLGAGPARTRRSLRSQVITRTDVLNAAEVDLLLWAFGRGLLSPDLHNFTCDVRGILDLASRKVHYMGAQSNYLTVLVVKLKGKLGKKHQDVLGKALEDVAAGAFQLNDVEDLMNAFNIPQRSAKNMKGMLITTSDDEYSLFQLNLSEKYPGCELPLRYQGLPPVAFMGWVIALLFCACTRPYLYRQSQGIWSVHPACRSLTVWIVLDLVKNDTEAVGQFNPVLDAAPLLNVVALANIALYRAIRIYCEVDEAVYTNELVDYQRQDRNVLECLKSLMNKAVYDADLFPGLFVALSNIFDDVQRGVFNRRLASGLLTFSKSSLSGGAPRVVERY
ncbi:hypothetical protein CVT26_003098 [Gymnopilus dilepis]|uniref:Uncharacterized protein n=1 Tax=Gymnopilus dilepis TaxID=231916 RepID=A0A409Y4R2_9AGAR|nr:hypothetical protein CVT26_003098 [Gymnopilus dilepis]